MLLAVQVRSMLESVARAFGQARSRGRARGLITLTWRTGVAVILLWAGPGGSRPTQGIVAKVGEAERRVLTENGLTKETDEVARTLDLLRKGSRGGLPRQKLIALLQACNAPQGEGDIRQAEQIYYRGKRGQLPLCWLPIVDGPVISSKTITDEVLKQRPVVLNAPGATAQHDFSGGKQNIIDRVSPSYEGSTPSAEASEETSIVKLTERLIDEKATLGEWNEKTQRQVRSIIATFVEMIGEDHVRLLGQNRIAEYRSLLLSLPRAYGKGQNDRKTPLAVWLERAKALSKEKIGRDPGTLNRHLTQLKEVLVYIEACGHNIEFTGVSKLLAKKKRRARDERNIFSQNDLDAIFRQPPWLGCDGLDKRMSSGTTVYHDGIYFVPLLARYTLARREELCGLDVDDVFEEDGIHCIFVDQTLIEL